MPMRSRAGARRLSMSSDETRSGASMWEMPSIFTVEYLMVPSSWWAAASFAARPEPLHREVINRRTGEKGRCGMADQESAPPRDMMVRYTCRDAWDDAPTRGRTKPRPAPRGGTPPAGSPRVAGDGARACSGLARFRECPSDWAEAWDQRWTVFSTDVIARITDTSEHARALRQTSPFAGVLDPRERWEILRRHRGQAVSS